MSDEIVLDVADKVATITLNRPERRNAFTVPMIDAWAAALADCRAREYIHVVVVTGAGKAFCSGGDIADLMQTSLDRGPVEQRAVIGEHVHRIPLTLADMDKPVIAALNGAAIGAGLDLALAMDLRFASASAKFAETYVKVGLAPGAGGAHWLPRLVGTARAMELLWSGDLIDAEEAARIGLVNRVFPDDELMPATMEIATKLANGPTLAIRSIKRLVREGLTSDLRTSLDRASSTYGVLSTTDDHREAVDAFVGKRTPRFSGR
jgi:enoyl-CoA hydratase/carnithine racemase